jgi:hypothetical protein
MAILDGDPEWADISTNAKPAAVAPPPAAPTEQTEPVAAARPARRKGSQRASTGPATLPPPSAVDPHAEVPSADAAPGPVAGLRGPSD